MKLEFLNEIVSSAMIFTKEELSKLHYIGVDNQSVINKLRVKYVKCLKIFKNVEMSIFQQFDKIRLSLNEIKKREQ